MPYTTPRLPARLHWHAEAVKVCAGDSERRTCACAPARCSARYGPLFSRMSDTYLYSRMKYLGGAGAAEACAGHSTGLLQSPEMRCCSRRGGAGGSGLRTRLGQPSAPRQELMRPKPGLKALHRLPVAAESASWPVCVQMAARCRSACAYHRSDCGRAGPRADDSELPGARAKEGMHGRKL